MSAAEALRRVRALHQRKGREEQDRFLVQGRKSFHELMASGLRPEVVYATRDAAAALGLQDAVVLPDHQLARMGTFKTGNELVAVVPRPRHAGFHGLLPGELVLALDGVSDPGNLGTIIRTAHWFGVRRLLCTPGTVDPWNPKCVQASMGSVFHVAVHEVDLPGRLKEALAQGVAVYLATMEGAPVFGVALQRPAVLVLGSESHGLSSAVRDVPGATAISVPRVGEAESLNVAVAAAALCMEFARKG